VAETALSSQRCFHHDTRETAARCTRCTRYFCRECVVEYDNRLVCAACLQSISAAGESTVSGFVGLSPWLAAVAGFAFVWLLFYCLGLFLLMLPSSFGDASVWGAR
jgi:hypothetical protein